ncbi:MAG: hypothetical protein ACQES2_12095 [Pseudomonadota bacterium]
MCLTEEFFITLGQAVREMETKGWVSLEDHLEEYDLKYEDFLRKGWIREKTLLSTADLHPYQLTTRGRHYLRNVKGQHLMIRPTKLAALARQRDAG